MFITSGQKARSNKALIVLATIVGMIAFSLFLMGFYYGFKSSIASHEMESTINLVLAHRHQEHYELITDDALHKLQHFERKGVRLGGYKSSFSDFFVTYTFGIVGAEYRKAPAEVIFTGRDGTLGSVRLDPPLDD